MGYSFLNDLPVATQASTFQPMVLGGAPRAFGTVLDSVSVGAH